MDNGTPWWVISNLMESKGTPSEIPSRVKAWRAEKKWSLDRLAKELRELAEKTGRPEYLLAKPALFRIEHGERAVSVVEALGLGQVFGKSIADLVLPEGSIEEAREWLLFEEAAEELNKVRTAAASYAILVGKLRNRISTIPHLRGYIERELAESIEGDEEAHKASYERRAHVKTVLEGTPLAEDPMPSFEEWRANNFLSPTPRRIAAEHILGDEELESELWYLGWDAHYIRNQFRSRTRNLKRKS